ncbi:MULTISPECIES: alpha/beta fold hydrolase [unclassified Nonomuraea]|uniref:alpha/beta fold hydrolase n=1 Tax=unclassified Nonomuraea TaxID=2593643 RepID=UPI0035C164CD
MPYANVNGVRLGYEVHGAGDPVLLVMGAGGLGRTWHIHQVPALVSAGYRVITFDNRGLPANGPCPGEFGLDDMVADTISLLDTLGIARCHAVGVSLGSMILQEVALARPGLLSRCVLLATRGRTDAFRAAIVAAELDLLERGLSLPGPTSGVLRALLNLSPATLDDPARVRDWLDVFEMSAPAAGPGIRSQLLATLIPDRLEELSKIETAGLVVAFEHDRLTPPRLGREVADRIPGCEYAMVPDTGHYGHLESPKTVNAHILDFLSGP